MSRKYQHAGLTEELYQRLVREYNALRVKYGRGFNGRIRTVRNCDVREARKYSQKFCNVIHERSRLSPNTAEDLRGLISDQLFNDLQAYLAENYRGKKAYQKHVSFDNIASKYRSKEGIGRNKPTVKHYLYRAYMLGV